MSKQTLNQLINLSNQTSAVTTINSNFSTIQTAFDNTLSRDGTQPNMMGATLDMNNNRVINIPTAVSTTEPVTLAQMTSALAAAGNINTGLTGVPVSAAMQPVVNASTIATAETLLGITPAMQPVVGASTVAIASSLLGVPSVITPEQYGAVGDGSHDDTAAVQAAINAAGAITGNEGIVQFGAGKNYKITSGLTDTNGVILKGSGDTSSTLTFAPTANGTLLTVSAGASSIFHGAILDLTIRSFDTTYAKTAIILQDVIQSYRLENIRIFGANVSGNLIWTGGAKSTGIQIKGREFIFTKGLNIFADQPLQISVNPNSTISLDVSNFHDTALFANGNPCILIDTGVVLSRTSFTGMLWCGGGTSGIQWIDNSSSQNSQNLTIENFGTEQGTSPTSYSIDIETNSNLYNFKLINGNLDPNRKGIKLRRCINPYIGTTLFLNNVEAVNADSTVSGLTLQNVYSLGPHVISGMTSLLSTPIANGGSSIPATAIYSSNSSGISLVVQSYTVLTLPAASSNTGRLAYVTDSNATITAGIGAVVAGGGANVVPVFSDGSNWRII